MSVDGYWASWTTWLLKPWKSPKSFGDAVAAHLVTSSDISKIFLVLTLGGTACAGIHSNVPVNISERNEG